MSSEEIKRKFVENVKLRGYDDKFIDTAEEKQIMRYGIDNGLSVEEGLALLVQASEKLDYVVESTVNKKAEEVLMQFATNDGVIDKKEFLDAVGIMKRASRGKLSDQACSSKIKQIILNRGWKVKEGFLKGGNWFSSI
jgi:hypothetical protein